MRSPCWGCLTGQWGASKRVGGLVQTMQFVQQVTTTVLRQPTLSTLNAPVTTDLPFQRDHFDMFSPFP